MTGYTVTKTVFLNVDVADDQIVAFVNSVQAAEFTNKEKGKQNLTPYLRAGANEILITGINTEGNGHYKGSLQLDGNDVDFDQPATKGGLTWSQKYDVTYTP